MQRVNEREQGIARFDAVMSLEADTLYRVTP